MHVRISVPFRTPRMCRTFLSRTRTSAQRYPISTNRCDLADRFRSCDTGCGYVFERCTRVKMMQWITESEALQTCRIHVITDHVCAPDPSCLRPCVYVCVCMCVCVCVCVYRRSSPSVLHKAPHSRCPIPAIRRMRHRRKRSLGAGMAEVVTRVRGAAMTAQMD